MIVIYASDKSVLAILDQNESDIEQIVKSSGASGYAEIARDEASSILAEAMRPKKKDEKEEAEISAVAEAETSEVEIAASAAEPVIAVLKSTDKKGSKK